MNEIGVTSDEPRYFLSVERIQAWGERTASSEWRGNLSAEVLRTAWDSDRYYNPHPPAYKIGMAATNAVSEGTLGIPASYRLSALLMFALLVYLVAHGTASAAGLVAGLVAGLSLLLMPRVFGHAHIAATDMPLTLFWFAATLGLYRYVRGGSRRWLVLGGVCMGLGAATKFTGFLLPLAIVPWMLLEARTKRSVLAVAVAVLLALVVAVLVNPGAWPDPVGYQLRLVEESLSRDLTVPISTHYRGASYGYLVPWEHPIVMTVITVPVAILALAAVGMKTGLRDARTRGLSLLCVVQVVFWLALIALPGSPNHDGVRLWLPMFPFLAVTAGLEFATLGRALAARLPRRRAAVATILLGLLYFAPPLVGTVHSYPYYLSYYGEAIGALPGADRRGMEVSYSFDAITASFRSDLNQQLPSTNRPQEGFASQRRRDGWARLA